METFVSSVTRLIANWDEYHSRKTTDKNHPIHNLVLKELPEILKSWSPNPNKYKFVGSDGQGNILKTPWLATLNLDVTDSATRGYYLVYLISSDLKKLVLSIGFGAYQFEKQYGRGKKFFEALDDAVLKMRSNSNHLLAKSLVNTLPKTNVSNVILDNTGDFNLKAYEKCLIYSINYSLDNLPSESQMKQDYNEYLDLYNNLSDSLLLAEVDSYVYENIDEHHINSEVSLETFQPKIFKQKKNYSSQSTNRSYNRYSKKSEKVGRIGEEIVFEFEKKKLTSIGHNELAEKINWHRNDLENRTPGWDITSFDVEGNEIYIEVKASESETISDVELTVNEWNQADKMIESKNYKIYLVTDVFQNPVIRVIDNPAQLVREGTLTLSIARYQLLLGSRELT